MVVVWGRFDRRVDEGRHDVGMEGLLRLLKKLAQWRASTESRRE
jgi:hypothetical protein